MILFGLGSTDSSQQMGDVTFGRRDIHGAAKGSSSGGWDLSGRVVRGVCLTVTLFEKLGSNPN